MDRNDFYKHCGLFRHAVHDLNNQLLNLYYQGTVLAERANVEDFPHLDDLLATTLQQMAILSKQAAATRYELMKHLDALKATPSAATLLEIASPILALAPNENSEALPHIDPCL